MAYADYKLCDVCGEKAFYDANLNYEGIDEDSSFALKPSVREAGQEAVIGPYELDYLGDWAVICNECSGKYKTEIVPIAGGTK